MVDNGSTDGTADCCESGSGAGDGRRVVTEPVAGLSRAPQRCPGGGQGSRSSCSSTTTRSRRRPGPARTSPPTRTSAVGMRRRADRARVAGRAAGVGDRRPRPVVQRPRTGRRRPAVPDRPRALRHQHVRAADRPPLDAGGYDPAARPARATGCCRARSPTSPGACRAAGWRDPSTCPRPGSSSRCCPSGSTGGGCCGGAGRRGVTNARLACAGDRPGRRGRRRRRRAWPSAPADQRRLAAPRRTTDGRATSWPRSCSPLVHAAHGRRELRAWLRCRRGDEQATVSRAAPLSVCCLTGDEPAMVAAALATLRPVADEIVVAVDSRVDPRRLGPLLDVADTVVRFEYADPPERARPWLVALCRHDRVLMVDGDEVPEHRPARRAPGAGGRRRHRASSASPGAGASPTSATGWPSGRGGPTSSAGCCVRGPRARLRPSRPRRRRGPRARPATWTSRSTTWPACSRRSPSAGARARRYEA